MNDIAAILDTSPVIPVLSIERLADAVPLAKALTDGGLRVLEITLRTPCARDAIRAVSESVPHAIVGAGTVLTPADLALAHGAGAQFIVSPGLNEGLARAANDAGIPLLPGVITPSEIMHGLDLGMSAFKFFPAEAYGGVTALKALLGPFRQIRFCPTGGITAQTAASYLTLDNVACVGGTWLAPKPLLDAQDWPAIRALAQDASSLRRRRP